MELENTILVLSVTRQTCSINQWSKANLIAGFVYIKPIIFITAL